MSIRCGRVGKSGVATASQAPQIVFGATSGPLFDPKTLPAIKGEPITGAFTGMNGDKIDFSDRGSSRVQEPMQLGKEKPVSILAFNTKLVQFDGATVRNTA
mmetsp:Transcript_56111/g.120897  ORF Transcript_56111/g.120897 Transcript_56111/m.120897 type:complete len:101 (+) Transcript_56111:78-380(+)